MRQLFIMTVCVLALTPLEVCAQQRVVDPFGRESHYVKVPLTRSGSVKEYRYRPIHTRDVYACRPVATAYPPVTTSRLANRATQVRQQVQAEAPAYGFERPSMRDAYAAGSSLNTQTVMCRIPAATTYQVRQPRARGYFQGRQ